MGNVNLAIGIVCGGMMGILLIIAVVFVLLLYFKIISCDDDLEGDGRNAEYNGLPLRQQLPFLTEEQRRRRERAMMKYRRNLEKEERRRARALRYEDRIREEGLDEAEMSASSPTSTQGTLITRPPESEKSLENSTIVYGHSEYVRHRSLTLIDSDSYRSMGCIHVCRMLSNCESFGILGRNNRHHRKLFRRQRYFSDPGEIDSLNLWDVDGLEDKSTDMDSVSSAVSSLPRPPEEVLGNNACTTTIPFSIAVDQPIPHVNLPAHAHDEDHMDRADRGERTESCTNVPGGITSRQDRISTKHLAFSQDDPLHGEGKANFGNSGNEAATTVVLVTTSKTPPHPPAPVLQESANVTQLQSFKKRFTEKDARHNISLSGFFTVSSLSAAPLRPTTPMAARNTQSPSEGLFSTLPQNVPDDPRQFQCASDTEDTPMKNLPFPSSSDISDKNVDNLENTSHPKGIDPDSRSVPV